MDRKLLLLINQQWTNPALDRFMAVLSSFDLWAPIFIVGVIALAVWGGFQGRAFLLVAAVAAGLTDGVVCKSLKSMTDRLRPRDAMADVREVELAKVKPRLLALFKKVKVKFSTAKPDAEGRSFPSSHAANTTTVAIIAVLFFRRLFPVLIIPLLVGYSRVYTGSHWPTDVLASFVVGLAVAFGTVALAEWFWRRFAPRRLPALHSAHPRLLPA